MVITNPLLFLRLEGPMQSWGIRSKWNIRDTALEPTKSGIIGLIACALGYKKTDKRIEDLALNLSIGVRVEKSGKIESDFHTVSRWEYRENRWRMAPLKTAEGKYYKGKTTELSFRSYIHDGSFLIIIAGSFELLHKIKDALQNPKWPVYLGRKSCVPIRPVFDKLTVEYSSLKDALYKAPWLCEDPSYPQPQRLRCVMDDIEGAIERQDVAQIKPARLYGIRRVSEFWIEIPQLS